jgi:hypothetical protein
MKELRAKSTRIRPRQLCRHAKKVGAVLPLRIFPIDQPNVGLIYEGRCLQRMIVALAAHIAAGDSVQFGVNGRRQRLKRFGIAIAPFLQELGQILIGLRSHFSKRSQGRPFDKFTISSRRPNFFHRQ